MTQIILQNAPFSMAKHHLIKAHTEIIKAIKAVGDHKDDPIVKELVLPKAEELDSLLIQSIELADSLRVQKEIREEGSAPQYVEVQKGFYLQKADFSSRDGGGVIPRMKAAALSIRI